MNCNTQRHTTTHGNTLQHLQHIQFAPTHYQTRSNTLQYTATQTHIDWTLYCNTLNTLQHSATHCNTLHHTVTRCNTLQHIATHCTHCNILQLTATHWNTHTECIEPFTTIWSKTVGATRLVLTMQRTATHYSSLQHTTTHCNTRQQTAKHCNNCNTLKNTTTHCNTHIIWTSQRDLIERCCSSATGVDNATHYNTLKHTETHCNT